MNDSERVRRATRKGGFMLGPLETERCVRHPRRWRAYRWIWPIGSDVTASEPEIVRDCAECLKEQTE